MIKIEWPFGPKLTCSRCGKSFKYRGTRDYDALDGAPAFCSECEKALKREEADAKLQAQLKAEVKLDAPTFTGSAAAPEIKQDGAERVEKAVSWAIAIANDNSHGYSMANRYGPDYDCSSLVISAFEWAGIPVGNAINTKNMYEQFIANGWLDVTDQINRSTGFGLIPGDVLLNDANHTCLFIGDGKVVNARTDSDGRQGDGHGDEIRIQSYWNYDPWNHILRWPADGKVSQNPKFNVLDVDGEFGPLTEARLREVVAKTGIDSEGVCDSFVWECLFNQIVHVKLYNGSKGYLVRALQAILNYLGENS